MMTCVVAPCLATELSYSRGNDLAEKETSLPKRFPLPQKVVLLPVFRDKTSHTIHLGNPLDEEQLRKKQTQEAPGGWHVQPLKACFGQHQRASHPNGQGRQRRTQGSDLFGCGCPGPDKNEDRGESQGDESRDEG